MDNPVYVRIEEKGPKTVQWLGGHDVSAKVNTEPCSIDNSIPGGMEGLTVTPSEAQRHGGKQRWRRR